MAKKKTTNCIVCGANITYATRKPSKCKKCRDTKQRAQKFIDGGTKPQKTKWKNETLLFRLIKELFPRLEVITNGYYSWLPSPKNEPMQLDAFCPEYKLAFEYNGMQHYQFDTYFHKTKEQFQYQVTCDKLKAELCKRHGTTLIVIKYDEDMNMYNLARHLYSSNPKLFKLMLDNEDINLTSEGIKEIMKGSN